ncbi:hypothetical protein QUB75_18815 [Microcoleus sp. K1-B6]|uniref:hypothetical protein n=1 Tax=unclassified Microcoleus TaxID=2642155 RepID=UPI002FD571B0
MSATCQIPLIAFYGRSGSMLHEIDRKRGSVSPAGRIHAFGRDAHPTQERADGRDAHPTV